MIYHCIIYVYKCLYVYTPPKGRPPAESPLFLFKTSTAKFHYIILIHSFSALHRTEVRSEDGRDPMS